MDYILCAQNAHVHTPRQMETSSRVGGPQTSPHSACQERSGYLCITSEFTTDMHLMWCSWLRDRLVAEAAGGRRKQQPLLISMQK